MIIMFEVPGVPVAQPRVKATAFGGHARVYTPKTADVYKASVAISCRVVHTSKPLVGPLDVFIEFVMPRPKAMIWKTRSMPSVKHDKKPDLDNLAKAVLDSLSGIAWVDDSQICVLQLCKRIASGGEQSHTRVRVQHA
jgi:Holliday junction resolvase RusA-like endonuclease